MYVRLLDLWGNNSKKMGPLDSTYIQKHADYLLYIPAWGADIYLLYTQRRSVGELWRFSGCLTSGRSPSVFPGIIVVSLRNHLSCATLLHIVRWDQQGAQSELDVEWAPSERTRNGLLLISTNITEASRILTAALIVTLKRQQLQMLPCYEILQTSTERNYLQLALMLFLARNS